MHKSQEIGPFRTTDKTFSLYSSLQPLSDTIKWCLAEGRNLDKASAATHVEKLERGREGSETHTGHSTQHWKGLTEENTCPVLGIKYICHLSVFYVRYLAFQ